MVVLESQLWRDIRDALPRHIDTTRIENLASAGIPDVTACRKGVDVWMELKIIKGKRIEVRYSQLNWIRRRTKAGAQNIFVVARGVNGGPIKIWTGITILLRSEWCKGRKGTREDVDSMTFDPGDPDMIAENWTDFEDLIFGKYD